MLKEGRGEECTRAASDQQPYHYGDDDDNHDDHDDFDDDNDGGGGAADDDGFDVEQDRPPPYWSTTHSLLRFWLKVETSLLVGWLVLVGLDLSLSLCLRGCSPKPLTDSSSTVIQIQ